MAAIKVSVGGQYTHHLTAERCVAHIRVSKDGESQAEVIELVSSMTNELSSLFKSLCPKDDNDKSKGIDVDDESIPVTHWSMSSLHTSSYVPYVPDNGDKERQAPKRLYTASTSFSVKFKDFKKLGQVCLEVTKHDEISISHLDWRLTEKTREKLGTTVRQGAVRHALDKAFDYVSVFSPASANSADPRSVCSLLPTDIRDEAANRGSSGGGYGEAESMRAAAFGGGRADGKTLRFEPRDVTLSDRVLCTFTATRL